MDEETEGRAGGTDGYLRGRWVGSWVARGMGAYRRWMVDDGWWMGGCMGG